MVSAPRQIAARLLAVGGGSPEFLESRLDSDPAVAGLRPEDRRLVRELVFGVTRWRLSLDWLIARKTEGRPQHPTVELLLRLGLYQIHFLDRIPGFAAVNETVEMARDLGQSRRTGFINAVLRSHLREQAAIWEEFVALRATDPATAWSHPRWLVDRWSQGLPPEALQQLLEWNNTPAATFARANRLVPEGNQLPELWAAEGVAFEPAERDWIPDGLAFELGSHPPLATLPSFQKGGFYAQDPSTLLAVHELKAQPGERVLDACAAPGGKTGYIAQTMGNEGVLVARDATGDRLERLVENCTRLAVRCVEPTALDAPLAPESFDRILVDAPCSNTGVLRRRVELRWRLRESELERLVADQWAILREVAPALKPGGTLVYSTCSLEPEENELQAETFARENPGFTLLRTRQLHPVYDAVDGAFVAVFRRA
jgi:16S rRNA (cytosine967-C5)-methyltransferase